MLWTCGGIAVFFAIARFEVTAWPAVWLNVYKSLAHVFVGGLWGAGIVLWPEREYLLLATCLTMVEIVAFLMTRKAKA